MAKLTVSGLAASHHLEWRLVEAAVVRIGRAPRFGWQIPWDQKISREHADLSWNAGRLCVTCLDTARNLILFNGVHTRELAVGLGEKFQIGDTTFVVAESPEAMIDSLQEYAFGRDELKQLEFGNPPHQMQVLARLPQLIAETRTDEELACQLVALLLEAIPRAAAAAVVKYDDMSAFESDTPTTLNWKGKDDSLASFAPSKRLVRAALSRGASLLHVWREEDRARPKYTAPVDMDWAICTPLPSEGAARRCLYVLGDSAYVVVDSLRGDVRFVDLMAQFIGSVQQVRELREKQARMSHFFSPAVMETISGDDSQAQLVPRETEASVLFCDVRGFSKMTEQSTGDLLSFLHRVSQALSIMTREIVKYDGIIADFQGDAALGFWGWPVAQPEGPLLACHAALAILADFRQTAALPTHPLTQFRVGIGVGHGRAVAGLIGSQQQSKVGVFGPVVNLSSRLESLTKQWGTPILVDEATAEWIRARLMPTLARCRRLGRVQPAGLSQPEVISELLPPSPQSDVSDHEIQEYEAAVAALERGDWDLARVRLEGSPAADGPSGFLRNFMHAHGDQPPPGWDGVIIMPAK